MDFQLELLVEEDMETFQYDLHVHTSEISQCGHVKAKDAVRLYQDAGYTGIVITDHYTDTFFNAYADLSWEAQVEQYLTGYKMAQTEGKQVGLEVFLGIEIRFTEGPNDYLVYGITPEFLLEHPHLYALGLAGFRSLMQGKGLLLYQAHPFRKYLTRAKPELLDGVEVYNGNPRHDSQNYLAMLFAQEHKLKMVAGSDFHQVQDLGISGMKFTKQARNNQHLVEILQSNNFQLITRG